MLPIEFIREHPDAVRRAMREKGTTADLDGLLAADIRYRDGRRQLDALRAERNRLSNEIKAGPGLAVSRERASALRAEIKVLEQDVAAAKARLEELMLWLPNIPWEGAPIGADAAANVVLRQEGQPPTFDFPPKDHVQLLQANGWADLSRVTKVCGART
jgi:seryl-tRNA synthetase